MFHRRIFFKFSIQLDPIQLAQILMQLFPQPDGAFHEIGHK